MVIRNNLALIGLVFGVLLFIYFFLNEAKGGLSRPAWLTLAVAVIMTVWWVTEAVPIYITGIVPLIAFPPLLEPWNHLDRCLGKAAHEFQHQTLNWHRQRLSN